MNAADDTDDDLLRESLIEPFRYKVIERIHLPSRAERRRLLEKAFFSVVHLDSSDVFIDLVTDSGVAAMSDNQWAGMMRGDEAYFRSRNFFHLEETVREITGYRHVIPTHQGRAAENILMELLARPSSVIPSNTLFDTTRAHVTRRQAIPVDLIGDWLWDFSAELPFKGNFDLGRLATALERYHDRIPFLIVTVLNNLACSSPVSMENIREVRRLADRYRIPVLFDAARFAENAYFIKTREPAYRDRSIQEIVREMFSYGHGAWMSAKKDGLVNVGGFIAVDDADLASRCQAQLVLYEGSPTYGGLARRDLEAMAIGLREGLEEDYLSHRTRQVAYLGRLAEQAGIVISKPVGGSGVFVDVQSMYPHLRPDQLPGVALACDLYLEGGVRAGAAPWELSIVDERDGEIRPRVFQFARLALPRRLYGKAHLDFVGKVLARVKANAASSCGYKVVYAPEALAHFFAKFAPITRSEERP